MLKKAQSAMEYLMTYGWAILIVIVVVSALYAMGVFTPTTSVACSPCFATTDFVYLDHDSTVVALRVGPRELTVGGADYSSGDPVSYTFTPCDPGWTECDVTVTYIVKASGLSHTSSATLHMTS